MNSQIDKNLCKLQKKIRVEATMLDSIINFEFSNDALSWYCLFLWCEAKDDLNA